MTPEEFEQQWFDENNYIIAQTSGSTGQPKPIRLLKADMIASAQATNRFFGIGKDDMLVCPLSVDYIAGKMMMVRGFVSGARICMLPPSNQPLWQGHSRLVAVVPSQVQAVLDSGCSFDNLLIGGAQLPDDMKAKILQSGKTAYESYGMTETCSHVALRRVGEEYFQAMPGVKFGVDGRECLNVSLDNFSFSNLQTNDLVELADGYRFRWLGRYDNVINTGGIKVFPEVLEAQISAKVPDMPPFYITSCADAKWGNAIIMVVERGNGGDELTMDSLRALLHTTDIDRCIWPKRIIEVDRLPRTSNGKIKRQKY